MDIKVFLCKGFFCYNSGRSSDIHERYDCERDGEGTIHS